MAYSESELEIARRKAKTCKTMAQVVSRTGMSLSTLERHDIVPGRAGKASASAIAQTTATLQPGSVNLANSPPALPKAPAEGLRPLNQRRPISLADRRRIAARSSDVYNLQILIKSNEPSVRESLAGNSHLPAEMQQTLANDPEPRVRFALACRPPDDSDAKRKLANDQSYEVRLHIARCGEIDTLQALASDQHEIVRAMVPLNPNADSALVNSMVKDTSTAVVENVLNSPHVTLKSIKTALARHSDPRVLAAAAANPLVDSGLLEDLLERTNDETVWACIAAHPNTRPAKLCHLAKSKSSEVRAAVAGNSNTPREILESQSRSKNALVASAARDNPAFYTQSYNQSKAGMLAPTF